MAVAATQLAQGTGAGTTTSSITPTANNLILIAIGLYKNGTMPTINSVSGNGITYALVAAAASVDDGFGPYKVHLYRGMSASPSTGTVSISLSAAADQVDYSICQVSGVDTSGTNGSGAVVQSNTGTANDATSLSVTLSAFGSVSNGAYGCLGIYNDVPVTPDSGWTELDDATQLETQWRADNDTSVGWSWTGATDAGGVAVEIKADAGTPTVGPKLRTVRSALQW